jgi:hypothetical protein
VHSVDVTEAVSHRSFDVHWAMPSVASANYFLKAWNSLAVIAWNSLAVIPVSGRIADTPLKRLRMATLSRQ